MGDGSDPASETKRSKLSQKRFSYMHLLWERRPDLNNPPTPVGGILILHYVSLCRQDLNNPPTPVGGILILHYVSLCRQDLNNPPTPVGGILILSSSFSL